MPQTAGIASLDLQAKDDDTPRPREHTQPVGTLRGRKY